MSKIVVFNVPAHGCVNPTLPVVHELVSRGEQVAYYLTGEFEPQIRHAGVEFRRIENARVGSASDIRVFRKEPGGCSAIIPRTVLASDSPGHAYGAHAAIQRLAMVLAQLDLCRMVLLPSLGE